LVRRRSLSHERRVLAIHGGAPAVDFELPPMWPGSRQIDEAEERAVVAALRRRCLYRYDVSPSQVQTVEQTLAERVGMPWALAVNSGTSALWCALVGLGIGPGDEVLVPAYTWIAVPNAVVLSGAIPVIVDVDETLTVDPKDAKQKLGPATRAMIAVHMRGAPCRMDELVGLGAESSVLVVEDVAQAPGGSHRGRPLGGLADASAFSFQGYKVVTAGEGGMALFRDRDVFLRAAALHDFDAPHYFGVSEADWAKRAFPSASLRMHELEAAVLSVQLGRLDATISRMRERRTRLEARIADVVARKGCRFRASADSGGDIGSAAVVFLPDAERARSVARALRAEGVTSAHVLFDPDVIDYHVYAYWSAILERRTPHGRPGPWVQAARDLGYGAEMCPRATDLLSRALHLDVNPELELGQVDRIADAVRDVLEALA